MDELSAAKAAYRQALKRIVRQDQERLALRRSLEGLERDLKDEGHHERARQLEGIIRYKMGGSGLSCRIDGNVTNMSAVDPITCRFVGMWRPPSPPPSPQESGAVAVVCSCLEELTNAEEVRLHWEVGCFDIPEYRTDQASRKRLSEIACPACAASRWVIRTTEDTYACKACGVESTGWPVLRESPAGFMNWRLGRNGLSQDEFDYWIEILRAHNPRHPRLSHLGAQRKPEVDTAGGQA